MLIKTRSFSLLILFLFTLVFSACTSSIITGDKKSDVTINSQKRNTVNCKSLNLANETLDVDTTRGMIHCLNENHSIEPLEVFLNELSDAELEPVVRLINEDFLKNKKRLYDLNFSAKQMEETGKLKAFFTNTASILKNENLSNASAQFIREFLSDDGSNIQVEVLKAMQLIFSDLGKTEKDYRKNLNEILEFTLVGLNLDAFSEMQKGFLLPVLPSKPAVQVMGTLAGSYIKEKIKQDKAFGKLLGWGIADGSLLSGMDRFFLETKEAGTLLSVNHQVQSVEYLIKTLVLDHKDTWFTDLNIILGSLDDSVDCLEHTKEIENANMFVLNRLNAMNPLEASYKTFRGEMMNVKAATSVCDIPTDAINRLKTLQEIANYEEKSGDRLLSRRLLVALSQLGKSFETAGKLPMLPEEEAELMPLFTAKKTNKVNPGNSVTYKYPKNERYVRLMVQLLGDRHDKNIVSSLSDLIGEMSRSDRRVLANQLYWALSILNGQGLKYRTKIQNSFYDLMKPRTELSGKSIYDLIASRLLAVSDSTFGGLAVGITELNEDPKEILLPLVHSIRDSIMFNSENPLVGALIKNLQNEDRIKDISKPLLKILSSKQYAVTLKHLAKMAEDGTLMEFLQRVFDFLGSSVRKDPQYTPPVKLNVPAVNLIEKDWNLSTKTEVKWNPIASSWPASTAPNNAGMEACSKLDMSVSLSDPSHPRWAQQLELLAECVNGGKNYQELKSFVQYATDPKNNVKDGKTLAAFAVENFKNIFNGRGSANAFSRQKAFDEFSDFILSSKSSDFNRTALKTIGFLSTPKYCGNHCSQNPTKKESLVGSIGTLISLADDQDHAAIQGIFETISNVLLDDSQKVRTEPAIVLKQVHRLIQDSDSDQLSQKFRSVLTDPEKTHKELAVAIQKYEEIPAAQVPARMKQLEFNYFNSIKVDRPGFRYANSDEFKNDLYPMLSRIADQKLPIIEQVLEFLGQMHETPYDPEWVAGWFQRMSANVRVIPYYEPGSYPGKSLPHVRIVNDLDLLEIIAKNADFSLNSVGQPLGGIFEDPNANFAVKYFSMLAVAGEKLPEFVTGLEEELNHYLKLCSGITGLLVKSEVKRRLANLAIAAPMIREMMNRTDAKISSNGANLKRNDLGFLRDLFFAIMKAAPRDKWENYERGENTMDVIVDIAEFGVLRSLGPKIWQTKLQSNLSESQATAIDLVPLFTLLRDISIRKDGDQLIKVESTREIFDFLLRKDIATSGGQSPTTFEGRFRFLSKLIGSIFDWSKDPLQKEILSSNGFELVRLLEKISSNSNARIGEQMMTSFAPILTSRQGVDFLISNFDFSKDIITKPIISNFIQKLLLEDLSAIGICTELFTNHLAMNKGLKVKNLIPLIQKINRDPRNVFENLYKIFNQFSDDPEWKAFKKSELDSLIEEAINWIATVDGSKELPLMFIEFTGKSFKNSDVDAILKVIGKDPEQFAKQIQFLSTDKYIKGIEALHEILKSSMGDIFSHASAVH